jgi:hypothetical protein
MKVQYFGDVNDYREYALLRLLAKSGGFKIGACWMLTPADQRRDGGQRSYIQLPAEWRTFDPSLFDLLATVTPKPELTDLQRIESEGLIPGAIFFNEIVPRSIGRTNRFSPELSLGLRRIRPRILRPRQRPGDPVAPKRTKEFEQVRLQG